MDWFFTDTPASPGEHRLITGEDAAHITRSLRMAVGEVLTLCDPEGREHLCLIERISPEGVFVRVASSEECLHEASIDLTLCFALTKGDKPETVIQKTVELGVRRLIPFLSDRCVSRPDPKSALKKHERYQKIARQAAMQSRRGIIPPVEPLCTLQELTGRFGEFDKVLFCYEGGGKPLRELMAPQDKTIAVLIGPEGGFEEREAELILSSGASAATLGKRILRAETAPLAAAAAIMFHTGNLE